MTRSDLEAITALAGRAAPTGASPDAKSYFARVKASPEWVDDTHSMRCPSCRYNMYEVEGHGIKVDFCLNCQAVWFDEGELSSTLNLARDRGSIDLIPDDVEEHQTASLICYMLDTLTSGS